MTTPAHENHKTPAMKIISIADRLYGPGIPVPLSRERSPWWTTEGWGSELAQCLVSGGVHENVYKFMCIL